MKRKIVAIVAMAATASAFAADFVWTGNTQHAEDWFDVNNWTVDNAVPETYPQAGDTAIFNKDASLNVNSDITVGTLVLNADLTHKRDKWLNVGMLSGTSTLKLTNRGRLNFTNSEEIEVSTPIDISNNDEGQNILLKAGGAANVVYKGSLSGSGTVSLEGRLKLEGDNSAFSGTGILNGGSQVEFRATTAGSALATWVYEGDNAKTSRINLNGDIYFGALRQTKVGNGVDFRVNLSQTEKAVNVIIGGNGVDSVVMGPWGDPNNNNDRPNSYSKIVKVGDETLTLYKSWHRLGTEIRGGVLEVINADALTGRNSTDISPIAFTGGTLRYGIDNVTDAENPVPVTTDWSARYKDSTEYIAIDTDGKIVTNATDNIIGRNPDVKGIWKKGAGELVFTAYQDNVIKLLTDVAYTNRINGGVLAFKNSRFNNRPSINAKILGTGTLRLDPFEANGAFRISSSGPLEEFEGTVDWATDLDQSGGAVSWMGNTDFNFGKLRWTYSARPTNATVVANCELNRTLTVGALDILSTNALVNMKSACTIVIAGGKGTSVLNGQFTGANLTLRKTGADAIAIGGGFTITDGSTLNVNEGVLEWNGTTDTLTNGTFTVASGVTLAGTGTIPLAKTGAASKLVASSPDSTVLTVDGSLDLSGFTVTFDPATADKSKTYPVVNATSFTGSATLTDDGNDGKGRWKLLSRTVEGKRQIYAMWTKNALAISIR